ncbi:unnamed protein product [Bursaphelenchus okinawaensis]|uniref:Uncharacterized protein n=1 Tax=Bursaphelenchus okinawaensis TaxID=465554 RepID=A0A811KRY5_9BILA|nr:unnamed protein product [Bursaphelenchus okinawaensis]CAG9110881.1 unnamed protein product [Bursaphelenchus okinawaensis]
MTLMKMRSDKTTLPHTAPTWWLLMKEEWQSTIFDDDSYDLEKPLRIASTWMRAIQRGHVNKCATKRRRIYDAEPSQCALVLEEKETFITSLETMAMTVSQKEAEHSELKRKLEGAKRNTPASLQAELSKLRTTFQEEKRKNRQLSRDH